MPLMPFVVLVNDANSPMDAFIKAKIKFNKCIDRSQSEVGDIALKFQLKRDTDFNQWHIAEGGVDVNYCYRALKAKHAELAVLEAPAFYIHVEERPNEYIFFGYATPCNEVE